MEIVPPGNQEGQKAQVLIITDEPDSAQVWGFSLSQLGLDVRLINITDPVLEIWSEVLPDLIIFEDFDSDEEEVQVCRDLRAATIVPILFLTSKTSESFWLKIYQLGADECIPFPISPRLFKAKVAAWLRRTQDLPIAAVEDIRSGGFVLNLQTRRLTLPNRASLRLSALEARLLYLLMNHPGQPLENEKIIEKVWGYYGNGSGPLLKNLVYRLRKKIEADPSQPGCLLTWGEGGYRFDPCP